MRFTSCTASVAAALAVASASGAHAQDGDYPALLALNDDALEGALEERYEAGLAASLDEATVAANSPRYLWALETKVQCGIALGYLKSSNRDETSIGNCQRAFDLMNYVPAPAPRPAAPPPPPPAAPAQRPAVCDDDVAGIVFFEFDAAELTAEAQQTLATIVTNLAVCGWRSFDIVGHTDQAGADAYNVALSQERAEAVQAALAARGVLPASMTTSALGESRPRVVLPDGTRSPQNRRVEISAN